MASGDQPVSTSIHEKRGPGLHGGPAVVGIGASAGGLAALCELFSHVPERSGIAWVVVVHLSPEHESHLSELIQPHSRLPVLQVRETTRLEADRVYVIPPGANLSAVDTHLRLSKLETERRLRAPIDHFFRTLAAAHEGHSVGVILSGTGSDGALGVKAIKERHGFVVVQDPAEAEYDGMPQSALATGMVDAALPLVRIAEAVIRFTSTRPQVTVPREDEKLESEQRRVLQGAVAQIRAGTGRNFGRYRPATVLRRIQRRMQIQQIEQPDAYLERLCGDAEEVRALADDLLIIVTSFFRDPEAWQAVEREVIPRLFAGKRTDASVRVWTVGCATGEEAYTLAMLLLEEAARQESPAQVQVFASDLHERALARARGGFYPGDIEIDVSPSRLERFFNREDGGYRVRKEVRERVLFAPHNLLGDPPFSRLDLVACRNVLIHLQREVQRDVLEIFHFALRPNGHLMLGTAEKLESSELFRVRDRIACVYSRRDLGAAEPRLPPLAALRTTPPPELAGDSQGRAAQALALGALHRRLIEEHALPSALVGPDQRLVHLSEGAGRYLFHRGGEPTASIVRMIRDELRLELSSALHAVQRTGQRARSRPIAVRIDTETVRVVLDVNPARGEEHAGFVLVVFEEQAEPAPFATASSAPTPRHLRPEEPEAELERTRERLQTLIDEHEAGQEEMQATHEELRSANEELHSALEELGTSKEELQSTNEELQTLNQEKRHKIEELSQTTSDLQNLLAATDIATLFLDRRLRILRFTPKLADLVNVRAADRGRPLSDLTQHLAYDALSDDARQVLKTLIPVEREVSDERGRWYLTRVLPYRGTHDCIEGVVITFVDITRRKNAEEAVRRSEERQGFLLELADAIRPLTGPVEIQEVAMRLLGEHLQADHAYYYEVDAQGSVTTSHGHSAGGTPMPKRMRISDFGSAWLEAYAEARSLAAGDVFSDERFTAAERQTWRAAGLSGGVGVPVNRDGRLRAVLGLNNAKPRQWTLMEIALIEEIAERTWVTVERARAEERSREAEERYLALYNAIDQGFCTIEVAYGEGDRPVDYRFLEVSPSFERQTGIANAAGRWMRDIAADQDQIWFERYGRVARERRPERFEASSTPLGRWWSVYAFPVGKPHERRIAVLFSDITQRKRAEEALRESEERFRLIVEGARDYAIFTVDAEGRITSWPSGAEVVFGWTAEEAIGQDIAITFTPEDRANGEPAKALALAREHGVAEDVRWHVRRDGARIFIEGMTRLLQGEAGAARGFLEIGQDVSERRRMEEALRQARDDLEVRVAARTQELAEAFTALQTEAAERQRLGAVRHDLLRQLVNAQEVERRRLSRELHDQLGQQVSALSLRLSVLKGARGLSESTRAELATLEALARATDDGLDFIVWELRPMALDDLGLADALRDYSESWSRNFGVPIGLEEKSRNGAALSSETETVLYRIAQEALNNVARHAQAGRVEMTLERQSGEVVFTVEDDGVGFDRTQPFATGDKGLGLLSMRERAALIGGEVEIRSAPGKGTTIVVRVPAG